MRALAPWRPFTELSTLHSEIDDIFNRMFAEDEGWWKRPFEGHVAPAMDCFVRNGEFVVRADLPGIDPKEVELAVEGDRLTIRGERKVVQEGDGHLVREVRYGRFERTLRLPAGVDGDSVKASYHDGVLEVTMKAPKGLTPKKVPIAVH